MDSNAKINYINPSACKILGYKEDEILGKNAHNLFHSHYLNNNMKQADCPIFCGVMQNKSFISNKEYFLNSEGKNIPVALNSKLVLSAKNNLEIVSSFSDISVQKKLEDKSNLLIKALESSINCIVITNKDAYVEWANPAFEKLTGFKISEIIGKNPKEFISSRKQTKEFYSQMWKTILDKKPWRGELINKKKDGSLYDEELIITPVLDEKGEIVNFIAIKQDITYRKIIALEKEEKDKIFFQQSKMAAMGEMLGNIAHQWRQPLSSISTAATGMKLQKELDCLTDDDFNYAMDLINNSAQYLSQTIDDFRGFFDPKNNKEKEFLISNVIDKALSIVSSQFVAKDIEIIKNIEDISIVSLENELIQVFLNILNNSKDILLKLEGEKRLIFINAYMENKEIIIEIKDNAKGINEEIIDRIFEPYFTTKHQSQGTGIGLYMCQNIIKNHLNGTLSVCNEDYMYKNILYRGAKFTIRI
jgi:PAS domain S-box-containing protein